MAKALSPSGRSETSAPGKSCIASTTKATATKSRLRETPPC
eukprot:CAMPEP_0183437550 /NCGR_PEP_ID=MMETSP0370-20130417/73514_1 /TAXON_ID=268820 /ORGANISM="Peridinium aciculiferum, Strain PAER-2" /LENGTH=40 /DNA_ID= /DNA_START= /DNA_END= /DNA_ORIENTATION=